jgi:hypothetical protein
MRSLLGPDHHAPSAVTEYGITAGRKATEADLRAAQERERLLAAELPRVREAATAWRNGLGGLLTALIGFSLVKGQSDISQLAVPWAVGVGVILLAAAIVGAVGALLLIRAANGRPAVSSAIRLPPRSVADHIEAEAAATALRRGIVLTLGCAALLVAAVGATWYAPGRTPPMLQITTPAGTFCGSPVQISDGSLTILTAAGDVTENLAQASTLQAVTQCQAAGPAGAS